MSHLQVFELRGVYVFRWDGEAPPSLARHYNEVEDRYEVPTRDVLRTLPTAWELVEDPDPYRVRFHGDPPDELLDLAVVTEDGPRGSVLLLPDEAAVSRALEAGGDRVD